MNSSIRAVLSCVTLFGVIVFANAVNDVQTSVLSTSAIVVAYQILLMLVGGVAFLIHRTFTLVAEGQGEITQDQIKTEEGFNIKSITHEDSKVIGTLGGKDIFDFVTVKFENGFEALYKFDNTVKLEQLEQFDVSQMVPGSLIIEPGVVYVPNK